MRERTSALHSCTESIVSAGHCSTCCSVPSVLVVTVILRLLRPPPCLFSQVPNHDILTCDTCWTHGMPYQFGHCSPIASTCEGGTDTWAAAGKRGSPCLATVAIHHGRPYRVQFLSLRTINDTLKPPRPAGTSGLKMTCSIALLSSNS